MNAGRAFVPLGVAIAAIAAACTQVSSDPNAVVALAFDTLPSPSVVIGDTLRDETGVVTPLRAAPLNSNGDVVTTAPVRFVTLDTGVTITDAGLVVATATRATSVRLVAQLGTLQSRPITLFVTPPPDSLALDTRRDTLEYVLPDESTNRSRDIAAHVLSVPDSTTAAVSGWIVRYQIEHHGTVISPTDVTLAWMVDESNRRSVADTTGADGRAARRLRVVATALSGSPVDSFVVIVSASARGVPLSGSPARATVIVRPK
jgi:hypothetical protein